MIYQPFRQQAQAGVCEECGAPIFFGDLTFTLEGHTICADCIESAASVARDEYLEDIEWGFPPDGSLRIS